MNFKRYIVILLFLAILTCSIATVSAADDGDVISADTDDAKNMEETSIPEADDSSGELKATETAEIKANETEVSASNSTAEPEVAKQGATLKASKATVAYKKSTKWTIKLTGSKNNAIAGKNIVLKVYTGSKYKTVTVKTDANGVAKYNTKSLKAGTHKIIASFEDDNYAANAISSSVKVVKQTKIRIFARASNMKDGSALTVMVMNKKTKKFINGVKLKLLVYTGKKYKTITLKTKKFYKYKGVTGYGTNKLTVGKHKVKITPVDIKYAGSKTAKMVIKKSAKKYAKWETTI